MFPAEVPADSSLWWWVLGSGVIFRVPAAWDQSHHCVFSVHTRLPT